MNYITPRSSNEEIKAWIGQATERDMLDKLSGPDGTQWVQWHTQFTAQGLFHLAGKFHYAGVLKKMVSMGYDAGRCDASGDTALHYALVYAGSPQGEKETIEFLLDCGLAHNEHNEQQHVPLARAILERSWKDPSRTGLEWMVLAHERGMSLVEEVSEEMNGTPLEVLARGSLEPLHGALPYEQSLIGMLNHGFFSIQQLKWAMLAAEDKILADNPDAGPLLNPIPMLRATLQQQALDESTVKAQQQAGRRSL